MSNRVSPSEGEKKDKARCILGFIRSFQYCGVGYGGMKEGFKLAHFTTCEKLGLFSVGPTTLKVLDNAFIHKAEAQTHSKLSEEPSSLETW